MGKRSKFERKKLDFYPTPEEAIFPLLPHLPPKSTFCEPCAGDGALIRHLTKFGFKCVSAFDVEPQVDGIAQYDASFMEKIHTNNADYIITNPPWDRWILHQIIERSVFIAPTWLLFDADWMHTRRAARLINFCDMIVSVGRVKWIEGSASAGKDNVCWYRFSPGHTGRTIFVGRS